MSNVYKIVDEILKEVNEKNGTGIGHFIRSGDGTEAEVLLIKHELVIFKSTDHMRSVVYINNNGKEVINAGGFEKWIAPKNIQANLKDNLESEKLIGEVEKLKYEIPLIREAKSRANLSICIAIASVICAIIAILISLTHR